MNKLVLITISLLFCKALAAQDLDYRILKTLNKTEMPGWDNAMKGVSFSVYPVMPASVIGIWCQGYFTKDKAMMRNGYKSAIAIGFALGVSTGLKYSVNRTRPFNQYPNDIIQRDNVGLASFPSGHTTSAFATATALSLSYKKWYVTVPSYLYAGFVGYSRMRLGVHYPTDVLAGALIGVGSGLLVWKIDKLIRKPKAKTPELMMEN